MSAIKSIATRMPVLFISHGGGPSFFLDGAGSPLADMDKNSFACKQLKQLPKELGLTSTRIPKAILVISAHWETTDAIQITSRDRHDGLYYDYYGFPPETYKLQYDAPGSVTLASQINSLLTGADIKSKLNTDRNFDHGVFIPMKVMFPNADIPIVAMSILKNYDPEHHIKIGRALAPLRDEGILIVSSGFITHNFEGVKEHNLKFVEALEEKLTTVTPEERLNVLKNWTNLPSARKAHAKEDHFVPMFTAAGAAYESTSVKEIDRTVVSGGRMVFANYIFE